MGSEEKLEKDFRCPKCRGTQSAVHNISLSRSSISQLIPINQARYIFVTCALCGYTEIYDQSIYVKKEQEDLKKIGETQEA